MLRLPAIAMLLALSVSSVSAKDRSDSTARPQTRSNEIQWTYDVDDRGNGREQLHVFRRGMYTTLDADEAPDVWSSLPRSAAGQIGDPVTFALRREAGALTCTGRVTEVNHAAGTCTFQPDEAFVRALASRNVALDDRDDLLGLTLVDAHLASVDGLKQAGFRVADSGDLMTVSALQVTPEFAAGLKAAGLEIEDLDNLVSARAVGVDAPWLQAMAAAGYAGLDADQAIAMRSLGVTPDYAQRMARVLASTEGK